MGESDLSLLPVAPLAARLLFKARVCPPTRISAPLLLREYQNAAIFLDIPTLRKYFNFDPTFAYHSR